MLINATGARLSLAAYGLPPTGSSATTRGRRKLAAKPAKLGSLSLASTGAAGHHSLMLTLTKAGAALLIRDKQLQVTVDLAVTAPGTSTPSTGSETIVLNAPHGQRTKRT